VTGELEGGAEEVEVEVEVEDGLLLPLEVEVEAVDKAEAHLVINSTVTCAPLASMPVSSAPVP
jgi:hypothetical protein